ncbi:hypothetical protein DVS28_b0408 (plasmid) [Euzebya pacifica]|uniref:Uncharacterized protein n=1 Tax=Euzebya pacifica TaxID=1608957 RepID=A0A346Y6R4_9ACTN|nr:hypothetical protein DVS28_b0408 [Euzebya pacifica]
MGHNHTSYERQVAHSQGQRSIRYRCSCGRIITGNAAWWSHTHHRDGEPRDGHRYDGRA